MADDLKGYSSEEVLNKVLNTSNDSLKVDIVSGAEYAEDSSHTDADTGNFVLGVRNDALAALGGTDGDYVPFQMNASGALYVEVASSSLDDSVYVDDADWTDSSSKHTLVGGLYQSSPQSITDGDTGPLQVNANGNLIVDLSATDNAVLDAMVVDLAAMEALLITIDSDTDAIKTAVQIIDDWDDSNYANVNANIAGTDIVGGAGSVASGVQSVTLASDDPAVVDLAAIEVLITATNSKIDTFDAVLDNILTKNTEIDAVLDTIDADTGSIKTAVEIIDDWDDSNYANVNANIAGTDIVGGAGTVASGVQRMTLASDDPAVANLNEMLYGTALAVTAVHAGSDHVLGATYQAFFIGVGGDVSLDMATSGTNIVFKNLASGQMLPVQATVVKATNTTATNIVALKA